MDLARQSWHIYARNFRIWITQPAVVIPNLIISIFFFVVFGSAFSAAIHIPGFPSDSYRDFFTAMILVQTLVFTSGDAGFAMLTDILSGYFDKLLLAPINRFSILMGSLLMAGTRMIVATALIVAIALALGVSFKAGVGGVLLILFLAATFGVAWSCIGLMIALRTKSAQATQSSFVLFFPAIFLTTGFMPKALLPGWFQGAVTINPVNYVLEAIRALTIEGWAWDKVAHGLLAVLGMAVVLVSITGWLFRRVTA